MKTLLYDLYTAQSSKDVKIHGGGEYIKKLFEYLVGTNSGSYRIITFYDKNKFMDERIIALIDSYNVEAFHVESISDIQRLIYDMKEQCDLFYSGLVSIYKEICFPDSIKKIATIHGLRELEISFDKYMSFYYPKRIYFKKMIGSLFYEYRINKKIEKINELIGEFDKIIGADTGFDADKEYIASSCDGFIAWKDGEIGIYDLNGRPVFAWRNYLQDSIMK